MMTEQMNHRCTRHPDPLDCPDAVVYRSPSSGTFGLIIHDGGGSYIEIAYCPWCATLLTGV